VRRMLPQIYRYEIQKWWEINYDAFIWRETKLQGKSDRNMRDYVFYSERSNNQYEIFWFKFSEELFCWIDRLQEAPKFQECVKKTCNWDTEKIATLRQLDHEITRAINFWVRMTLEGYIIEFADENHQSFSRSMPRFEQWIEHLGMKTNVSFMHLWFFPLFGNCKRMNVCCRFW
jgi:hypothetical protein